MYSVQEVCEEQERQYNQLMQEDDQYCHPESFKWGFEHGFEYALTKLGWHPVSETPKVGEDGDVKVIVIQDNHDVSRAIYCEIEGIGIWDLPNIKWWCYPPKED